MKSIGTLINGHSGVVNVLPKSEYDQLLHESRKELIHSLFAETLRKLFSEMRESAMYGLNDQCQHQVTFEVPEHLGYEDIEHKLQLYFEDINYKAIVEPRDSENSREITISLM